MREGGGGGGVGGENGTEDAGLSCACYIHVPDFCTGIDAPLHNLPQPSSPPSPQPLLMYLSGSFPGCRESKTDSTTDNYVVMEKKSCSKHVTGMKKASKKKPFCSYRQ